MKTTFSAAALALALAVGGTAIAQAHAQTPAPAAPHRARTAQPVSQADFIQRRIERLRAADADGDGRVTAEEMRARIQTRRAEARAARFDRLDANKDGALSRAEFEAPQARDGRMVRGPRMGHGRMGSRAMEQGERRFPIVVAEAERKAALAFARMDADHDGVLTVEERRAAMPRVKRIERRIERRPASPSAPASE
ncbi:EF-hand domain-containing protein [Brevundimonas naejangsanensis]|nr:EF-hand domain-containing protein [Brevundimonas naejangsanensis]